MHFEGHLRATGAWSYDCLAVFAVKDVDGNAYAAAHSGRIHGSDESGDRNLDWNEWSVSEDLRDNWSRIRAGASGGSQVSVTADWSLDKIKDAVVAVAGFVLKVALVFFGGGGGEDPVKESDPHYGDTPDGLPPSALKIGAA